MLDEERLRWSGCSKILELFSCWYATSVGIPSLHTHCASSSLVYNLEGNKLLFLPVGLNNNNSLIFHKRNWTGKCKCWNCLIRICRQVKTVAIFYRSKSLVLMKTGENPGMLYLPDLLPLRVPRVHYFLVSISGLGAPKLFYWWKPKSHHQKDDHSSQIWSLTFIYLFILAWGVHYCRVLCIQVHFNCAPTGASTENSILLKHLLSRHDCIYNPQAVLVA